MMDTHTRSNGPARLQDLAAMAALLERLEREPRAASAAQYRDVVRCVSDMLAQAEPGPTLDAMLSVAPATAELYENLQYGHAGLCRSPLEASLEAELAAHAAIRRAQQAAPAV
jgi:hypothetical protein